MLIVFTLIGNSLQALTLPKVSAEKPSQGRLSRSFHGSAVLSPAETADLTNPAGWKVAQVLVKPGDAVHRGQQLVSYDDTEAQRQIEDETAALEQLELPKPQLQHRYVDAVQSGDEEAILDARTALESADASIRAQQNRIERLRHDASADRQLVAPFDGIVTEVHAVAGLSAATGGPDVRLADAASGFQFRLQIPAAIADTLKPGDAMDVRLTEDDSRSLKGTVAKIEDGDAADATAPSRSADDGAGDMASSESGSGAANSGSSSETGSLPVTVTIKDPSLRGGERVEVELSRQESKDALLVSAQAIHQDRSGVYVYAIEKRQSPLGNAYYAARRDVTVIDENGGVAAVGGDLYDYDQVVLDSSEPLQDGVRVRL
nr:HlyD family efflux transporter periplasmic adaptor subunit [Cohnella zeiphila]